LDDTWQIAGGIQFKPATPWTFVPGLGYNSSAVKDQHCVQRQFIPAARLEFSFEYALPTEIKVDQNRGLRSGLTH